MQTPNQADISPRTETKLGFLGSRSLASSGSKATRDPRTGTVSDLLRSGPLHGSTRQTLLYLGVQSVPPRRQDSQPDLGKRAGKWGYPRLARAGRIANHANPEEPCAPPSEDRFFPPLPETSPGLTASKLRQLRPSRRHCPLRRGSAPPSRQVSPVARPRPVLRSGQHPADPAPLPSRRSNWAPHTPLHNHASPSQPSPPSTHPAPPS